MSDPIGSIQEAPTYTWGQGTTILITNDSPAPLYYYWYSDNGALSNTLLPVPTPDPNAPAGVDRGLLAAGASTSLTLPAISSANAATYTSNRLVFSAAPLTQSLEQTVPVGPSAFNASVDADIPYSNFEFTYAAQAPFVQGGMVPDLTLIDGWSYPIQWSLLDTTSGTPPYVPLISEGFTQTYGLGGEGSFSRNHNPPITLQAMNLVEAYLISTPFLNPGSAAPAAASTGDLIWNDNGTHANKALNRQRVVGPLAVWQQSSSTAGIEWPSSFERFTSKYGPNENQLSNANGYGSYTNYNFLNQLDTSVIPASALANNGYSYALNQAAAALGGVTTLSVPPFITQQYAVPGFQGFFTFPAQEGLGQITYIPDQYPISLTVGALAGQLAAGDPTPWIGTGRSDKLTGTRAGELFCGGLGGDRLCGGGGADVFLYLRADSSAARSSLRDTIIDFNARDDRIDLSLADGNSLQEGRQAFTYIGSSPFSGEAGELRFRPAGSGGVGLLQGDTDGDGRSDFEIRLLCVNRFSADALTL